MNTNLTRKDLSVITLDDITRYLIRKGFKFDGFDKRGLNSIFIQKINNQNIALRIPTKEEYSDFIEKTDIIIIALSEIFSIEPQIIYSEIIHSIKDIMRMRVINPGIYSHSLPLDYASKEIVALKDLFLYGACSEVIELPYFEKPLSEGLNYIQTCQFGHTFEGSFGFTINVPIIKKDQLFLISEVEDSPYERKVSERIMRGLITLKKSVDDDSSDLLVNSFESAFNARMCDSIIAMTLEDTKQIEISAEWSSEYKPDQSVITDNKIIIGEPEYHILQDASARLKQVEPYDQIIIGNVITLHSKNDPNLDDNFLRTIIMRHQVNDRSIDVKIYLSKDDYLKAYNAHGSGKKIKVTGKMFRTGSTWKMNEVSNVEEYV
jgi:hypothetical protein